MTMHARMRAEPDARAIKKLNFNNHGGLNTTSVRRITCSAITSPAPYWDRNVCPRPGIVAALHQNKIM